jgi:hypothetical protein
MAIGYKKETAEKLYVCFTYVTPAKKQERTHLTYVLNPD